MCNTSGTQHCIKGWFQSIFKRNIQKFIPGNRSGIGKDMEKERHGTYMGNRVCSNLRCTVKDRFEKICQALEKQNNTVGRINLFTRPDC